MKTKSLTTPLAITTTRQYATDNRVLYVDGAAQLLGQTSKAIRARVARRTVPFRKFQGRVIFLRDELEALVRALPGCSLEEATANVVMRER